MSSIVRYSQKYNRFQFDLVLRDFFVNSIQNGKFVNIFGRYIYFDKEAINYIHNYPDNRLQPFIQLFDTYLTFLTTLSEQQKVDSLTCSDKDKIQSPYSYIAAYFADGRIAQTLPTTAFYPCVVDTTSEIPSDLRVITRYRGQAWKELLKRQASKERRKSAAIPQKQAMSPDPSGKRRHSTQSSKSFQPSNDKQQSSSKSAAKVPGNFEPLKDDNFKQNEQKEGQSDDETSEEDSEDDGEQDQEEQAEELRTKTTVTTKTTFSNLSRIQRARNHYEQHVAVTRGNYSEVNTKIIGGSEGGYVITGPTGCGKSTVAILPLFKNPKTTVLMVEPTQANAANILHEFQSIIPNLVKMKLINMKVPESGFVAPTVSPYPFPRLAITTTDKLLEYFYHADKFPKVDYLILDEFHLPIPSMVYCVEYLRVFNLVPKYVLVSATAKGISVSPQLPSSVKVITGSLLPGKLPRKIDRTDLDPRKWRKVGDGTMAIVAPSVSMAKELHDIYKSLKIRSYLITRYTAVSRYLKAARDYKRDVVYVLEPGVEAGVTLSISVLISMGCSSAIRYDGRIVVEDVRPLDKIAAIQRGGRGGRVKPTLYVVPRSDPPSEETPTADYYRAQAIIWAIAYGADTESMNCSDVLKLFPKLNYVTRESAIKAVTSSTDPFVAMYMTSEDGQLYKECGGEGKGFHKLARKELYVYYYDDGFYVAPISDFSNLNSRPDTFVLRSCQFDAAKLIVDSVPGLSEKFGLSRLVNMLIEKFDKYKTDLFREFKVVFPKDKPQGYFVGTRAAEVEDFVKNSEPLVQLFSFLKKNSSGVNYERTETSDGVKSFGYHSFHLDSLSLHYSIPEKYTTVNNSVNIVKLSNDTLEVLKGILCIELLLSEAPDKCVNLNSYKDVVPKQHLWFDAHVKGHRPM